ncbi:MAG: hypothetical protein QXX38_00875 [Candidatus Aenigmatarchaeota archaeon]
MAKSERKIAVAVYYGIKLIEKNINELLEKLNVDCVYHNYDENSYVVNSKYFWDIIKDAKKSKIDRIVLCGGHFGVCHSYAYRKIAEEVLEKEMEIILPLDCIYDVGIKYFGYSSPEKEIVLSRLKSEEIIQEFIEKYLVRRILRKNIVSSFYGGLSMFTRFSGSISKKFSEKYDEHCWLFPSNRIFFDEDEILIEEGKNNRALISRLFTTNKKVLKYLL